MSFSDLLRSQDWQQVDFVKVDIEGAEPLVLRSLMTCVQQGLRPPTVMFEFEPAHYRRAGFTWEQEIVPLRDVYRLFSVDYEVGGMTEILNNSQPERGRNVFAIPGDGFDAVAERLQIGLASTEGPLSAL